MLRLSQYWLFSPDELRQGVSNQEALNLRVSLIARHLSYRIAAALFPGAPRERTLQVSLQARLHKSLLLTEVTVDGDTKVLVRPANLAISEIAENTFGKRARPRRLQF